MSVLQSAREYLREVRRAYFGFVFGWALAIIGAVGLFIADQDWIKGASIAGILVGVLVAPHQAFHSMRVQRDIARGEDPLRHLRLSLGLVNDLSGSNWAIDHFAPVEDDGFATRVVVGARHPTHGVEFDTSFMLDFARRMQDTAIEHWLGAATSSETNASPEWRLVSPTNDHVMTARRDVAAFAGGRSELYARCTLQTPRPFTGVWPVLILDVVARDVGAGTDQTADTVATDSAVDRFRLDLPAFVQLLDVLAYSAIEELAPPLFTPLVKRSSRERIFKSRLELIGPNFNARTRPGTLFDVLDMPHFTRITGARGDGQFLFETPDVVDVHDRDQRLAVLRRAIRLFLRRHEFLGFEDYVEGLGHGPTIR